VAQCINNTCKNVISKHCIMKNLVKAIFRVPVTLGIQVDSLINRSAYAINPSVFFKSQSPCKHHSGRQAAKYAVHSDYTTGYTIPNSIKDQYCRTSHNALHGTSLWWVHLTVFHSIHDKPAEKNTCTQLTLLYNKLVLQPDCTAHKTLEHS